MKRRHTAPRWWMEPTENPDDVGRTEKQDCEVCRGTGIGQTGPPDKSTCWKCHGKGWV